MHRVAGRPKCGGNRKPPPPAEEEEEEEEEEEVEFFNHCKNDLERQAHTPSGVAGADLKSQAGGARGRFIYREEEEEERV
jgi:hypothetical protein